MTLIAIEFIELQVKVVRQRVICKLNVDKAYDHHLYDNKCNTASLRVHIFGMRSFDTL